MISHEQIEPFRQALEASRKVLIVSHKNPDGDTLGSALGLYFLLISLGKEVNLLCANPVPKYLSFLPMQEKFRTQADIGAHDLIIIVDTADKTVSGLADIYPQLFDGSLKSRIIDIDHHPFNGEFGFLNIVDTKAASATVILTELLESCGYGITSEMATCFLTGLYTDTGSFMHQNTDKRALAVASRLLAKGANLSLITKSVFRSTSMHTLKLWGRVFSRVRVNEEGVAVSVLTESDYLECGASREDSAGSVDYLKYIPGVKYATLLTEDSGKIKGSLRTIHDDVDVQKIARQYGGGGHVKAAGFMIPGRLQKEEVWKVVA